MDWLMQIEIAITLFFQNLGSWLEYPMQSFTFLGNELFFLLIMPAIYWSINPAIGFRAGMMLILSGGLNSCLKMAFHSPRPFWMDPRVEAMASETSFGLPSGHSQNSAAIWGMIAASLRKKWVTIIITIIIFMVGLSRIYLGVHFVRDVLSGWLIGILIVILYLKLEKPVSNWLRNRSFGIQILFSLAFALSLIALGFLSKATSQGWVMPQVWSEQALAAGAEAPDPFSMEGVITIAGVAFGFTAGYAWWFQRFEIQKINPSSMIRFARYVIGLIGIVAIYFGLKMVFPEEPVLLGGILRFIRYTLIGMWVTAFAPWLFRKLHLE